MIRFIKSTLYYSLAWILAGYLFVLMHWPNGQQMLLGALTLHTISYIAYVWVSKETRDPRSIYAILLLLGLFVSSMFNLGGASLFLGAQVLLHLFAKEYLKASDIKGQKTLSILGASITTIGVTFKVLHWPGAYVMIIVGLSCLMTLLLLIGMVKGRNKQA